MSIQAFLQDPVAFMTHTIVLPPPSATPNPRGLCELRFRVSDKKGTNLGTGQPCDIVALDKSDNWNTGLPSFEAFFCPYNDDALHLLVVDAAANLMFTPTMNGCSFGVGSATTEGPRLVGHVNVSRTIASQLGADAQELSQANQLHAAVHGARVLGSSQYTPFGSGQSGTTFGVRNQLTNKWKFYRQVWKSVSGSYQLVTAPTKFA